MSLGYEVAHAMHREDRDQHARWRFTCTSCGRAFPCDRVACPACGGTVGERQPSS